MVYFKFNFVLFINLLSIFQVSLLDTVHFTNSPNKILRANNFTTYKVEVPNGEAITIIEANTPLINKNLKFNDVENTKYSINHNRNQVMDLKTSLSMTVTPHNNNDEYENLAAGEEESVTNDYGNLSPEHTQQHHQQHSVKTVYSPELLQKFLKDYAKKMVQASEATTTQEPIVVTSEETLSFRDKYESIEASDDDDSNRRVSSADTSEQDSENPTDIQERKRYRPGSDQNNFQNQHNNKNSGWVTLEAVPWSKSKVSKWQSSVKPSYSNQNNFNHQSNNNGGYNRPHRPPPYNYEENDDNDDYYQRPNRPTFQNNQFYSGGSPQSSNNRPPPDSQYSHHSPSSHHSSSSQNNYDNDYRPNRPYQPEIITDNRPSNFPNQEPSYGQNEYSHNRPNSYENRPSRPHNDYQYSGSNNYNHYSNKDGSSHPLTYPGSGSDGEWVLVSTTKGYQFPKRNGQRAMLFQAQNGVEGTDTRKNDNKGIITAASQHHETSIPFRPPYQVGPTKTTQQQVKLTILPLFVKNENRPHYNSNSNNMDVNVYKPPNYNGIIETEPSSQTIEESVAAAASANEANAITASAQILPKRKRKRVKNYVMRKNPSSDSTAVLAAVGAGLLPASLGLIAPMILGK